MTVTLFSVTVSIQSLQALLTEVQIHLNSWLSCHPLEQKEDIYDECVSIKMMVDQIMGDSDCSSHSGGAHDKELDSGSVSEHEHEDEVSFSTLVI